MDKQSLRLRLKQKGFIPILIVLLTAAAIGGYLIYSGKINIPQKQVAQTLKSDASPAPTGDAETANWKTYISDKYGYSFQYPANLTIQTGSSLTSFAYDVQLDNINYNISFCKPNYCELPNINQLPLSFQQETVKKTTDLIISGKPAYRIEGQIKLANANNIYQIKEVISLGADQKMEIDANVLNGTNPDTLRNLLDQILSTVKFLDQSQIDIPYEDWVEYRVIEKKDSPDGKYTVIHGGVPDINIITIKDKNGGIINGDRLSINRDVDDNLGKYGLTAGGGYFIKDWKNNSTFILQIIVPTGDRFETEVDVTTGKIIESSFKKIK